MNHRTRTVALALTGLVAVEAVRRLRAARRGPHDRSTAPTATLAPQLTEEAPAVSEPVSRSLRPYTWSSEDSVAYEAAMEAINHVVAAYSGRIAAEEAKPASDQDPAAVRRWREERAACQHERQTLTADNREQVEAARRTYAERLQTLREASA